MWEEEEDNLKISSTPNLALSHDEADGMALAAVLLHNPALFWCSTCAVALHSTEVAAFSSASRKLKTFYIMCFTFSKLK